MALGKCPVHKGNPPRFKEIVSNLPQSFFSGEGNRGEKKGVFFMCPCSCPRVPNSPVVKSSFRGARDFQSG